MCRSLTGSQASHGVCRRIPISAWLNKWTAGGINFWGGAISTQTRGAQWWVAHADKNMSWIVCFWLGATPWPERVLDSSPHSPPGMWRAVWSYNARSLCPRHTCRFCVRIAFCDSCAKLRILFFEFLSHAQFSNNNTVIIIIIIRKKNDDNLINNDKNNNSNSNNHSYYKINNKNNSIAVLIENCAWLRNSKIRMRSFAQESQNAIRTQNRHVCWGHKGAQ